jgi:hypothetical protein
MRPSFFSTNWSNQQRDWIITLDQSVEKFILGHSRGCRSAVFIFCHRVLKQLYRAKCGTWHCVKKFDIDNFKMYNEAPGAIHLLLENCTKVFFNISAEENATNLYSKIQSKSF